MGCKISNTHSGTVTPFVEDGPTKKDRTVQPKKDQENTPITETAITRKSTSRIQTFKISHSDLISEKTGKIQAEYTFLQPPIGKGAFGEVRRAVHKKTNLLRAVKIIIKETTDPEDRERLVNEVKILKGLDHPNIMKIFEFYQDEKAFYIVTELYNGGELFDKISKMKFFSEKLAAVTIKQILSAVFYCHQHNIVHRDLKPENVLYESKKEDALIKVIDFGTSRNFDAKKKMNQKFGTPYYIAPEVIRRKYDEKCDVWSCGVMLYILLCGYPPFNGPTDKVIMEKVALGHYSFDSPEWQVVSNEAKSLVKKMLEYNPTERLSAEKAIADPWIAKQIGNQEVDMPLAIKALSNLKTFRVEQKLQEATWVFLVNYLATKEEKKELLKTFQALDKNGDGQLNREELISVCYMNKGYRDILNMPNPEAEVEAIFKTVDYNNSGAIDYSEFVVATINRRNLLSKERLETAFKMFDKDGSGYLTPDELKEAFGSNFDEGIFQELIQEFDDNSDGKISYKEFRDMMLKFLQ